MQANPAKQREFTGWHMLGVLVLFFGTIIGVNIWLAIEATTSWTGLVVENSYVASQEFNTKLANARAQDAMGWQGGFAYEDGQVRFTLVDGEGKPIRATSVTVALSRPIGTHGDQTLTLNPLVDGSYGAMVDLIPGAWNAHILATFDGQPDYEHNARLIAPSN